MFQHFLINNKIKILIKAQKLFENYLIQHFDLVFKWDDTKSIFAF